LIIYKFIFFIQITTKTFNVLDLVKEQDTEICMFTVKKDGLVLQYVKEQDQ
jgi:hypothetical protein